MMYELNPYLVKEVQMFEKIFYLVPVRLFAILSTKPIQSLHQGLCSGFDVATSLGCTGCDLIGISIQLMNTRREDNTQVSSDPPRVRPEHFGQNRP